MGYDGASSQVKSVSDTRGDVSNTANFSYDTKLQKLTKISRGTLDQNYERDTDGRLTSANATIGNLIAPISRYDYNAFDSRSRRTRVATDGGTWRYKPFYLMASIEGEGEQGAIPMRWPLQRDLAMLSRICILTSP
jgi:hypothetical protein